MLAVSVVRTSPLFTVAVVVRDGSHNEMRRIDARRVVTRVPDDQTAWNL
jgi:hypothetical protein